MSFSDFILIILVFLILYNYVIYPLVLIVLGNFFVRRIKADLDFSPPITFLIAAHNEESLIKGAVQSILELNYPKNQIKIIIGSDGSTDNTNAILEQMQVELGKNFNYFIYPRSGKNKVLNDLINKVETDFILFMDADCRVSSSTAIEIMKNYSDERVGCVIASQSVISENNDENTGRLGDTLYHKYEQIIRINESKIHSNVNSLGYLYSVRKNLLKPIPDDFVCDDLYNVYSVLENGFRVVFEKNAHAREIRQKSLNNELHRRVRAVAGGIATVFAYYRLMNVIKYGWVSFFLISHKVFRWLSPLFIIMLAIFTIMFWESSLLWYLIYISQILVYLMSALGWVSEQFGINFKIAKIFLFFISMNYSSLLGTIRFLKRSQNAIWDRIGFNGE